MKKVLLSAWLSTFILLGQGTQLQFVTPPPPPVTSVSASVVGEPGSVSSYYWVVANFTGGNAVPYGPVLVSNSPPLAQLSSLRYVTLSWDAVAEAVSYDVLRTATSTAPTGACDCAVTLATTSLTTNDTARALSGYTVTSATTAFSQLFIDNRNLLPPNVQLLVNGILTPIASGGNSTTIINNTLTSGNGLISGGGVAWVGSYNYIVSPARYMIQGVTYTSPQTSLTLAASHATLDRIDVIAVNTSGTAVVIQGTNSATPEAPDVDPSSQLQLTFIYVAALSTTPGSGTTNTNIYLENTEWTGTSLGAPINLASTSNPYAGTKDIEGTAATTGNYFMYQAPAPIDTAAYNNLVLYFRPKSTWPTTRSFTMRWYSSGTAKGVPISFTQSSTSQSYQQIVVPLSLFQTAGLSVNQIRFTVAGSGATIGFYVDNISLQGGVNQTSAPSLSMIWKDTWNATTAYVKNDVARIGGTSYVALVGNTNLTPVEGTTWAKMVTPGAAEGPPSTWGLCIGTPCITGTTLTGNFIVTGSRTLSKCYISAKTAPTGATLIADILKSGTSIFGAGTKLVLAISGTYATQGTIANTALVEGDILTISLTQVGSTIAGQDVTVVCKTTI